MPEISIEFFPPRTPEVQKRLEDCLSSFKYFKPKFYSVTFGAGGSTLEQTPQTLSFIKDFSKISVVPHLTCIGSNKSEIKQLLDLYKSKGISRIIALRGDMPSGMEDPGELRYAADLVQLIREYLGDKVHISVAAYPEAHPQSESPDKDLLNFKAKIDAGANDAITQYFFNFEAYENFMDRSLALGIKAPIYPGIMPITNYKQLKRFSDSCGAEIPRWIDKRLADYDASDTKESLCQFGTEVIGNLCEKLEKAGAPGFHFYSLNRHEALLDVFRQLNWSI